MGQEGLLTPWGRCIPAVTTAKIKRKRGRARRGRGGVGGSRGAFFSGELPPAGSYQERDFSGKKQRAPDGNEVSGGEGNSRPKWTKAAKKMKCHGNRSGNQGARW